VGEQLHDRASGVRATFTLYSVPVDVSHDVRGMDEEKDEVYHRRVSVKGYQESIQLSNAYATGQKELKKKKLKRGGTGPGHIG
jgi:hypothetical protein